jgi:tripartite-type tricarboxylate transporter receptor subunit TctC
MRAIAIVASIVHDAFKKALDDPEHLKALAQLDQVYWYRSSEDYAHWAAATLAAERATIERVGLLGKGN